MHRATPEQLDGTVALVGYTVAPFREQYRDLVTGQTMEVLDELAPQLPAYLRYRPEPWTIVHGDFRADNLLFGGPRVVVVDWQTVAIGPAAGDLSYLLGASLTADVRRQHEDELVDRYLARLAEQGVTVDRDEIWEGYRRWAFSGLVMAVAASALVRRTARGDEMFVTMADRHAQQAIDLDSLSLIAG